MVENGCLLTLFNFNTVIKAGEKLMSDVPESILRLVETFDKNIDNFQNQTYNETQVRQQFINPFFEAIGWDMQNKAGIALAYSDVIQQRCRLERHID